MDPTQDTEEVADKLTQTVKEWTLFLFKLIYRFSTG